LAEQFLPGILHTEDFRKLLCSCTENFRKWIRKCTERFNGISVI